MWPLIKTDWAYRKYSYIFAIVCAHLLFFYLQSRITKHTPSSPEHSVILIGTMLASMMAAVTNLFIALAIVENKETMDYHERFYPLLPLSIDKQSRVRLLTGSLPITAILILESTLYLFFLRNSIGHCYLLILASGLVFFNCQILTAIIADISTTKPSRTWLANPWVQFSSAIFLPTLLVILGFVIGGFNFRKELYHFALEIACASILITSGFIIANQHSLRHRQFFLR